MTDTLLPLDDFHAAADRLAGRIRRTPTLAVAPLKASPTPSTLLAKLENLQVTGSFKARGATNTLLSLDPEAIQRGLITASGGNHGLAVAYAAYSAGIPAVIFLPESTPSAKADKLRAWGAEVVIQGGVWDDANQAALARAEHDAMTYIHPFADSRVIAGQGTLALEVLADHPEVDVLVVAIGGGGLISGVATAAKLLKPSLRVIGVEPVGAPTLSRSLAAGELVTLETITTAAGTLAPRRSAAINLAHISHYVDEIVLVDDKALYSAARWLLWFELGTAVELSAAAAIAALQTGQIPTTPEETVCAVICGAGSDGLA